MKPCFLETANRLTADIPTPFTIFDMESMDARIRETQAAWAKRFPNLTIAYSFKSNPARAILKRMKSHGLAAEVVSGRELKEAVHLGFSRIIFNGPVKKHDEIRLAMRQGARLHVDSLTELNETLRLAKRARKPPALSFRLAVPREHQGISRFGMTSAEFREGLRLLKNHGLFLSGAHIHTGSNLRSEKVLVKALRANKKLIEQAYAQRDRQTRFCIDLGGGYPGHSVLNRGGYTEPDRFAEAARRFFDGSRTLPRDFELAIEPGRCLVEDFGYLITQVEAVKRRGDRVLTVIDAGLHMMQTLHGDYHPMRWLTAPGIGDLAEADIRGCNCFETDIIADGFVAPASVKKGDRLAIGSAGGYDIGTAMVWTRKLPPIFGVENGRLKLLRRETDLEFR